MTAAELVAAAEPALLLTGSFCNREEAGKKRGAIEGSLEFIQNRFYTSQLTDFFTKLCSISFIHCLILDTFIDQQLVLTNIACLPSVAVYQRKFHHHLEEESNDGK